MVDLTAVKDLRRGLRRKFASRSNLPRIFEQWDIGNTGSITTKDLIRGLDRLGIQSTHEQALTLLASAKTDQNKVNEGLTKEEFKSLLFSGDESFSVNLNKLSAPTQDDKEATMQTIHNQALNKRIDLASLNEEQFE